MLFKLNPDNYKDIKYKGLHRQKTIDESNKKISEIIKNFNESCSNKFGTLNNKLNSIIKNLIEQNIKDNSNKIKLGSFLIKKIDYESITKYFENSTKKFKSYTDFYIGKDAPKYSPKDLFKEFNKCSELSLKDLEKSIGEYTAKFLVEISRYVKLIETNKKKLKEKFSKTTEELGLLFSKKMGETIGECFKKLENPLYNESEFKNTKNKETVESWNKKIKDAENEFDKHIEEYAIDMFINGDKYLENSISNEKTTLEQQMNEVLENYQKELEKNIDEYVKKKENEKLLNDENEFKKNLSSCKSLINNWHNELKKHSKKYKKAPGGKGTVAYKITTATGNFDELKINIPSSLKSINNDVWTYVNNIISATLVQDDIIKKLGITTNLKNYKLPGEYKEINNTDAKKAILCLMKIAISDDLKSKPFIDDYVKNLETKIQSNENMIKIPAATRGKKKGKK